MVNKSDRTVDAEDKQGVKSKMRLAKKDLDEKEMQVIEKQEGYVP